MKKVLVIANLYYASPRIPQLFNPLAAQGYDITIITPPVDGDAERRLGLPQGFLKNVKVCGVPHRDVFSPVRKVLRALRPSPKPDQPLNGLLANVKKNLGVTKSRSFLDSLLNLYRILALAFPDDDRPWKRPAMRKAAELFAAGKFDVIFSSSPFPTAHWIASGLKRKYDVPWVADFRDPWSQNHDYPYGPVRKWLDTRLEKRIMANADFIVAATGEFARKQKLLLRKETAVITNGFAPAPQSAAPRIAADKLRITYTGKIYQGKQDPGKILAALRKLTRSGAIDPGRVSLDFYGPPTVFLENLIKEYELDDIAHVCGVLPGAESLQKQREAQLLLLLNWDDPAERGIYPTKLFEYLSAERPILATGGYESDEVQAIIERTRTGRYAVKPDQIERALVDSWAEFKNNGLVSYHGEPAAINQYSYANLSEQLAQILQKFSN